MPFKSAAQEAAMKRKAPKVWAKWVKKYGHHPDFVKKGPVTPKRVRKYVQGQAKKRKVKPKHKIKY